MSVLDDSVKRCSRCGWPLVDRIEDGCTEGNCSMRPMPPIREEAKMTAFHAVGEPKESATTITTLRAENERLMARLKFVHELLTEIEFGGPYKEGCNFCGATEAPHATNCALDYYDHLDDGEDGRAALKGGG